MTAINSKAIKDLSRRVKTLRKEKDIKSGELEQLVGISPGIIEQIETLQCDPSVSVILKIAKALKVHVSQLFDENC